MNKLLLIAVLSCATLPAFPQSIAKLKIGQTPCEVEKIYGRKHSTSIAENVSMWIYNINEFKLEVIFDNSNRVALLVAVGDNDGNGVFQTKRGVRLGDSFKYVKVIAYKGLKAKEERECEAITNLKYNNITFTFCNNKVSMITLEPRK